MCEIMSSQIFITMLQREIDLFVATFQNDSNSIFYNSRNTLIHPGEYGMYREQRFRTLLQSILTRDSAVSDGFIITSVDNHYSSQCDVLIHNAFSMPLTDGGLGKFYPVEDVHAIVEIKSNLSKNALAKALQKLAEVKMLGNDRKGEQSNKYSHVPYFNTIPTFLVCNKLDFADLGSIDFDSIYAGIDRKYWHNAILSIEDGILAYTPTINDYSPTAQKMLNQRGLSELYYEYSSFAIGKDKSFEMHNCIPVLIHFDPQNRYDHIIYFLMMIKQTLYFETKYSFDGAEYINRNLLQNHTKYHSKPQED